MSAPLTQDDIDGWGLSPRGAGYIFGSDVVRQFNQTNKLQLICRAHQLVMEGYKMMFDDSLVTVWSALRRTKEMMQPCLIYLISSL